MLSDETLKRSARCSYHHNLLNTKTFLKFPIQRYHQYNHETDFLLIQQIDFPIVFDCIPAELGMKIPLPFTTVDDIAESVGKKKFVKIIEVGDQSEIGNYNIGEFAQYLKHRNPTHKVLNMISLEFSSTPLNSKVQAPLLVRSMDWIDIIWPLQRRKRSDYPTVQKYCLAGMEQSYTDFHIDFGGTSVWYHILWGRKRFFLIPPTLQNLIIYKNWTSSKNQSDIFLGDLVNNQCYRFDLHPGETFIIPSGWIHAVYTVEDSLVFGGNFLHAHAIVRQLQCFYIENVTSVGKAYRFPQFRQIHFYFLCHLLLYGYKKYASLFPQKSSASVPLANETSKGDDEDDDQMILFQQIFQSQTILYQLPYLVKTCEMWIHYLTSTAGSLANDLMQNIPSRSIHSQYWSVPSDYVEFCSIVQSTLHCNDPIQVVEDSWVLLLNHEKDPLVLSSASSMDTSLHDHVMMVKGLETIDFLDESHVVHVFDIFDVKMKELLSQCPTMDGANGLEKKTGSLMTDPPYMVDQSVPVGGDETEMVGVKELIPTQDVVNQDNKESVQLVEKSVDKEDDGGSKYNTRGYKLSADYLMQATDRDLMKSNGLKNIYGEISDEDTILFSDEDVSEDEANKKKKIGMKTDEVKVKKIKIKVIPDEIQEGKKKEKKLKVIVIDPLTRQKNLLKKLKFKMR